MILTTVGLAIILAAWAVQLTHTYQGNKDFHRYFLLIYVGGVIFLTIGGRENGLDINAILNISSVVLATLIFLRLRK